MCTPRGRTRKIVRATSPGMQPSSLGCVGCVDPNSVALSLFRSPPLSLLKFSNLTYRLGLLVVGDDEGRGVLAAVRAGQGELGRARAVAPKVVEDGHAHRRHAVGADGDLAIEQFRARVRRTTGGTMDGTEARARPRTCSLEMPRKSKPSTAEPSVTSSSAVSTADSAAFGERTSSMVAKRSFSPTEYDGAAKRTAVLTGSNHVATQLSGLG